MIQFIEDKKLKKEIARSILKELPQWFGIEESLEDYVLNSAEYTFVAYLDEQKNVLGFYSLKATSDVVLEIYVCAVRPSAHRLGIGRKLFDNCVTYAKQNGYEYMQVKTVELGRYGQYDQTNSFYKKLGFKEFEVFPKLWDEHNPCQIYIKSIV